MEKVHFSAMGLPPKKILVNLANRNKGYIINKGFNF
jgi:hypothetical protein